RSKLEAIDNDVIAGHWLRRVKDERSVLAASRHVRNGAGVHRRTAIDDIAGRGGEVAAGSDRDAVRIGARGDVNAGSGRLPSSRQGIVGVLQGEPRRARALAA